MDGVAYRGRRLHVERRIEEGEPGVLHGWEQQALSKRVHERAGHGAPLDRAPRVVVYGEQFFSQPGQVDEVRQIRLGDGPPVGAEAKTHLQVLEAVATADDRDDFTHAASLTDSP